MKVLIQHGARLHETKGILDTSVSQGYDDIVDFVLSQEYVQFEDKERALRKATFKGHLCVLKTLISHGQSLPSTPLHLALSSTRLDIALLLLENGADVGGLNRDGKTPVDCSIPKDMSASEELIGQYAEIIQTLIKNGANPNGGGKNQPPLHQASYWGHLKLVQLLRSLGSDVNLVYDGDRAHFSSHREWGKKVSPLHDACKGGNVDVVAFLLDNGAEIDATDSHGDTPLMYAVSDKQKLAATFREGPRQKFKWVESNNTGRRNTVGETALHLAAGNRNREQFLLLVRAGARLDITTDQGDDPLMINEGWGRTVCSK